MKYIKKFLKECFRYKLSGFSMVACLSLSMLAAYYGITIFNNLYYEHKEQTEYQYQYTTTFNCMAKELSELPSLPENINCNLKITNYEMYLSDTNTTNLVHIALHSKDENWPLVSGYYPNEKERNETENPILIGQAFLEYTYEENGNRYYDIFDDKYKVVGVFGSKNSVAYDYYIVLYADSLGEKTKKMMEENEFMSSYNMILESNTEDTDVIFQSYIKNNYAASISAHESYFNASAAPIYNEKEFCIIIYLFCFICIAIIMKFWMVQRSHEMQVCKAFGYSNRKVILRLLRSFGCMMLFSLIVFSICCSTINFILKDSLKEYHLEFSWNILIPYFAVFFIAVLVVSIKPVYVLITKSIASSLHEG